MMSSVTDENIQFHNLFSHSHESKMKLCLETYNCTGALMLVSGVAPVNQCHMRVFKYRVVLGQNNRFRKTWFSQLSSWPRNVGCSCKPRQKSHHSDTFCSPDIKPEGGITVKIFIFPYWLELLIFFLQNHLKLKLFYENVSLEAGTCGCSLTDQNRHPR
jgi:hypothetical protein